MTKETLYHACLGIPGCSHPAGAFCGCSCHECERSWEKQFQDLWNELIDWAGSGFRYQKPDLTGRGLDTMKIKFEKAFDYEIQKQRMELISLVIANLPKPLKQNHFEAKGFNEAIRQISDILKKEI